MAGFLRDSDSRFGIASVAFSMPVGDTLGGDSAICIGPLEIPANFLKSVERGASHPS